MKFFAAKVLGLTSIPLAMSHQGKSDYAKHLESTVLESLKFGQHPGLLSRWKSALEEGLSDGKLYQPKRMSERSQISAPISQILNL